MSIHGIFFDTPHIFELAGHDTIFIRLVAYCKRLNMYKFERMNGL